MQPVMQHGVERPIGLHRQPVDSGRELAQLLPLGRCGEPREQLRRLHFQRFAHDEMPAHVFARRYADARPGTRTALQ